MHTHKKELQCDLRRNDFTTKEDSHRSACTHTDNTSKRTHVESGHLNIKICRLNLSKILIGAQCEWVSVYTYTTRRIYCVFLEGEKHVGLQIWRGTVVVD